MSARFCTDVNPYKTVAQQRGSGLATVSDEASGDIMRLLLALSLREREVGQPLGWKQ